MQSLGRVLPSAPLDRSAVGRCRFGSTCVGRDTVGLGGFVQGGTKGITGLVLTEPDITCGKDTHHHGPSTMGSGMLSEIVTARELLATFLALERLVLSVERAVVTLEVFLTTEATRAKGADKRLGGVVRQRLLATPAGSRKRGRRRLGRQTRLCDLFWLHDGRQLGSLVLWIFIASRALRVLACAAPLLRSRSLVVVGIALDVLCESRAVEGWKAGAEEDFLVVEVFETSLTQEVVFVDTVWVSGMSLFGVEKVIGGLQAAKTRKVIV